MKGKIFFERVIWQLIKNFSKENLVIDELEEIKSVLPNREYETIFVRLRTKVIYQIVMRRFSY